MKKLFFFIAAICLFSACLEKTDAEALKNTKWELTEFPGNTLPSDAKATLNIADSLKISGKSFCNNYGGQGEIVDGKLTLKNIFGTKMFCKNSAAAESAYLKALNQVNKANVKDGKLTLLQEDKPLLVFSKVN
ncbi:META domain-containing protein [Pedobacter sp. MW01-1-1]|uniref:META domain-containing protein n=1 Tax=Pedobacter sp. MW01-1-1 TaxID=3383027 RepID=UPI003FED71C9